MSSTRSPTSIIRVCCSLLLFFAVPSSSTHAVIPKSKNSALRQEPSKVDGTKTGTTQNGTNKKNSGDNSLLELAQKHAVLTGEKFIIDARGQPQWINTNNNNNESAVQTTYQEAVINQNMLQNNIQLAAVNSLLSENGNAQIAQQNPLTAPVSQSVEPRVVQVPIQVAQPQQMQAVFIPGTNANVNGAGTTNTGSLMVGAQQVPIQVVQQPVMQQQATPQNAQGVQQAGPTPVQQAQQTQVAQAEQLATLSGGAWPAGNLGGSVNDSAKTEPQSVRKAVREVTNNASGENDSSGRNQALESDNSTKHDDVSTSDSTKADGVSAQDNSDQLSDLSTSADDLDKYLKTDAVTLAGNDDVVGTHNDVQTDLLTIERTVRNLPDAGLERELRRRLIFQDYATLTLLIVIYFITIGFGLNVVHRLSANHSSVKYYSHGDSWEGNPSGGVFRNGSRNQVLLCDSHEVPPFLRSFNKASRSIKLRVFGFADSSMEQGRVERFFENYLGVNVSSGLTSSGGFFDSGSEDEGVGATASRGSNSAPAFDFELDLQEIAVNGGSVLSSGSAGTTNANSIGPSFASTVDRASNLQGASPERMAPGGLYNESGATANVSNSNSVNDNSSNPLPLGSLDHANYVELQRYLEEQNDMEVLVLQKSAHWKDWQLLATRIKGKIREEGFVGHIDVRFEGNEEILVFKNTQWTNFVHNPTTIVLLCLSGVGLLWYAPYMWLRYKHTHIKSRFDVRMGVAQYWRLIERNLSSTGFSC